ncbi:RICIN domain-containing protein [Campylobacter vicugnae]|uniref:RICIN domain-containing protein n=2 Tax=Campylobacter vicugnae TaxID=1660076 RepID=UPI00254D58C3|nr:RICIN domain-containing protein [Campylobacter ovis]MDL0107386.1 hypothetical protein [Campylobacter ovis]
MSKIAILALTSLLFISCSAKPYIADRDDDIGFAGTPSPSLIDPISLQSAPFMQSNSDINSSNMNMDFNNTNEPLFLNSNTQIIPPKPSLNTAPPFITAAPAFNGVGTPSAPLAIINPHGSALTVWALAEGNWIWGYTLDNSREFGDARVWQIINLGDDIVLIKNLLTNTCINDEGRGITHRSCNRNNRNQQWQLLAMDNGAAQLRSTSSRNCIKSEFGSITDNNRFFSITMEGCSPSLTIGQQWIFIPEPTQTSPLLGDR